MPRLNYIPTEYRGIKPLLQFQAELPTSCSQHHPGIFPTNRYLTETYSGIEFFPHACHGDADARSGVFHRRQALEFD